MSVVTTNVGFVPTKTRIRALLVDQGALSPFFPANVIIGCGIALTLCGVIMAIFGSVSILVELPFNTTILFVGCVIFFTGILSILSGHYPDVSLILLGNLFLSIVTVASSTFIIMLSVNTLLRDIDIDRSLQDKRPGVALNSFFLMTASMSSILSFISLALTGREACLCYSQCGMANSGIPSLKIDTLQRKDRIIEWILEQSYVSEWGKPNPEPIYAIPYERPQLNRSGVRFSCASTSSSRITSYDV